MNCILTSKMTWRRYVLMFMRQIKPIAATYSTEIAIDETATHKDKSYGIWLCILKRGEYCVIRVSNEVGDTPLSAREVGRIYQQGYTTKQGHDGVGLSSIQNLASRYKGMIYTQMEDKVIHFIAKIPINYAKGGEDYG